jgi:hypothetical protein
MCERKIPKCRKNKCISYLDVLDMWENLPDLAIRTSGSVGWACVAHLSFCFEETSIDDSHQVSVHLGKRFRRKRFFRNRTNQKQELPVAAMFDNG